MKKIFLILIILFNFNFVYSQHTGSELMKFIKKIPSTETELDLYKKGMLNGIILGYKNGMQDGNTILKSMLKKNGLSLVPHSKYGYGYPLLFIDELMLHCVPKEINGNQLIKIVEKYTENNPKVWHKDLLMIMSESIKDAQLERCDVDNYMDNVLRDKGLIK